MWWVVKPVEREGAFMMMPGMWVWTVVGILLIIYLVILIAKQVKK